MKKQRLKLNIAFVCIAVLCVLLTVGAYFYAYAYVWACAAFCSAIMLVAFLLVRRAYSYTDSVMAQLSELISSISSLGSIPVATEYEDSLLSKLQSQTVKLTEMMLEQNRLLNNEKEEIKSLISDISHQLKTPVASLRTYGDLLLECSYGDVKREEYLSAFACALDKLTFLTDSLVKLSRLESGIIVLTPRVSSLNDTVLGAAKQVFRKASDKGIELFFDSDKTKVALLHDEKWMEEAVFNVLDNAVKYTDSGSVTINLSAMEMYARLDITDTGSGIEPQELPKIFGRFYRGTNASGEEGVGIGLYLARRIITEHGGYIKVKSDKNGSTFSLFLPL